MSPRKPPTPDATPDMADANVIPPDRLLGGAEVRRLVGDHADDVAASVRNGDLPGQTGARGRLQVAASDLVAFLRRRNVPVPALLASAARRKLLIVDPDARSLAKLREAMSATSLAIDTSTDDVTALLRIGAWRPDVLLLAVPATSTDGLRLCRALVAHEMRPTKIMVMSARWTSERARAAYQAGADRVITTPVVPDLLASMVHDCEDWDVPDPSSDDLLNEDIDRLHRRRVFTPDAPPGVAADAIAPAATAGRLPYRNRDRH